MVDADAEAAGGGCDMIKCDPRAKARCPYKKPCCGDEAAYFVEGSECDKFNQEVLSPPPTNADHIRSMTDDELAENLFQAYRATVEQDGGDISTHWCDGRSGCIDEDGNIECDEKRHKDCILRWLKSEAKPL